MNMIFHLTIPNLGLRKIHDGKLFSTLPNNLSCSLTQGCWNRGCQEWHFQFLADELTLFQPGRADSAHPLLLTPPHFFTFPVTVLYVPWIKYFYKL